ncbi:hypothetical protein BLA29_008746, partial [Euroglyphus maynei]
MVEDVCLVIKAANQKYEDIKVDCKLSWSILDLKNHLSINYPSKPKITDQRIIYSGHLLKDNQLLTNIIKPSSDSSSSSNDGDRSENTFIFHLVCPQKHLTMNDKANSGEANGSSLSTSSNNNNLTLDAFPNTTGTTSSSTTMPSPTVTWNQFNQLNIQTGPDNMLMQQSYQMLMNQYYQYMSYYFLSSPPIDFVSYAAFTNAYMQSIQPVNDQQFSNSIGTSNINVTTVPNNSNNNNNLNNNRINRPQPQAAAAA